MVSLVSLALFIIDVCVISLSLSVSFSLLLLSSVQGNSNIFQIINCALINHFHLRIVSNFTLVEQLKWLNKHVNGHWFQSVSVLKPLILHFLLSHFLSFKCYGFIWQSLSFFQFLASLHLNFTVLFCRLFINIQFIL